MKMHFSALQGSFVALVCGSLLAGCAVESEQATEQEAAVLANSFSSMGETAVKVPSELRLELGKKVSFTGEGWTQASPGVWSKAGTRIVAGVDGHRAELAERNAELEGLRKRLATEPELAGEIAQREAQVKVLEMSLEKAAKGSEISPQVTCNIGFINGPSSPWVGIVGAIGGAQASCYNGCAYFTIAGQACTNFGCSPTYSASNWVCNSTWTFGAWQSGSPWASCASAASISPPGISATSYFPCN